MRPQYRRPHRGGRPRSISSPRRATSGCSTGSSPARRRSRRTTRTSSASSTSTRAIRWASWRRPTASSRPAIRRRRSASTCCERLGGQAEVGDRVPIGFLELIVRDTDENGAVTAAGLALAPEPAPGPAAWPVLQQLRRPRRDRARARLERLRRTPARRRSARRRSPARGVRRSRATPCVVFSQARRLSEELEQRLPGGERHQRPVERQQRDVPDEAQRAARRQARAAPRRLPRRARRRDCRRFRTSSIQSQRARPASCRSSAATIATAIDQSEAG